MPTSSETTPLLPTQNGNGNAQSPPFSHRVIKFFKAEGEPSWLASYRYFFFDSWFNILLVFIPLSFIAERLQWDAACRFGFSFMAIMPLAALLGTATDQMSLKLGQTLAGLLNATFGNAVEIIVGVAALLQNQLRIVQTSMLGSILSNLLLVLGCSFFAGGLKYPQSDFDETAAQASSSLMTLACITLVIPAAYHTAQLHLDKNTTKLVDSMANAAVDGTDLNTTSERGLLLISRGTALLLLVVYVAYLVFQLRTHADMFTAKKRNPETGEMIVVVEEEEQHMNVPAAACALLLVTVTTSFCADYLVASIEQVADSYKISQAFIGVILLPIVANAAEHVTSVWMARKDKMALTIGICVGSSIQISTFVVPLLVIVGWITDHNLTLYFTDFETIVLFVSVLLVQFLIQDGKSNYMEGMMLMTLYLVIAISFWVS
ncbi:calcium/proton exchanger [Daedalea quercina L-15889]|uniref:Vacuolar calcium ion transporter n=1 Tax=Daedalea quercina L-15889 TaxID=1314783 RepID=A0A165QPR2_9APHY|nr:calcium/proton exchanger [Daedalea quercina L-15889]